MTVPIYVVIPVKDRHGMTATLLSQLEGHQDVFILDNGSTEPCPPSWGALDCRHMNISAMWNLGLDLAAKDAAGQPHDVAVLNNDLEVPPGFLQVLSAGLRSDDHAWISYPNWHGADLAPGQTLAIHNFGNTGRTLSGWAFMVRGESGLRVDEQFEWWFGDDDIELQVRSQGKQVLCVGGCTCAHLEPGKSSSTPGKQAIIREDHRRFVAKWGPYLAELAGG